jgi:hypothetical protein
VFARSTLVRAVTEDRQLGEPIEWRPSRDTLRMWGLLSLPMLLGGVVFYGLVASRGNPPSGGTVEPLVLLAIAVISVAVMIVHELVHGAVIAVFGARPRFGATLIGGSVLGTAFYTTAPGHVFTRRQYLAVTLAPTVLLSVAGIPACLLPFGNMLWLPFAIHFTGCVGDLGIARLTYRQPAGTGCEDLRDGVRFWPSGRVVAAQVPAHPSE